MASGTWNRMPEVHNACGSPRNCSGLVKHTKLPSGHHHISLKIDDLDRYEVHSVSGK